MLQPGRRDLCAFCSAGSGLCKTGGLAAIAVALGAFGVTSGQALSGVVGPLIGVPVLIALVYVSLARRRRFTSPLLNPAEQAEPVV